MRKLTKEELLDAADRIEKHGLVKESYFDTGDCEISDQACCIIGSVMITIKDSNAFAIDKHVDLTTIVKAIEETEYFSFDAEEILPFTYITEWNDDKDRTKEQVAAVLRRSAELI